MKTAVLRMEPEEYFFLFLFFSFSGVVSLLTLPFLGPFFSLPVFAFFFGKSAFWTDAGRFPIVVTVLEMVTAFFCTFGSSLSLESSSIFSP